LIDADAVHVDGNIYANGGTGANYGGSGSGGSIRLQIGAAGTLTGSGTVQANGYPCWTTTYTGAGGGGRIAVLGFANEISAFPSVQARGGTCNTANLAASPGTIYLLGNAAAHPDVVIENDPAYQQASTRYFDESLAGQIFNSFSVNARLRSAGGFAVIGDMAIKGRGLIQPQPWSFADTSGGVVAFAVGGTLRIEDGGTITTSSLGYLGGLRGDNTSQTGVTHPGTTTGGATAASDSQIGAGSYGGLGGARGGGTPSITYGDLFAPVDLGSGGAQGYANNSQPAGNGGGSVQLTVGSLMLDGDIYADGEMGTYSRGGSGSGGSISIVVTKGSTSGEVKGAATGTLNARGGDCTWTGGTTGGGGGRVAIRGFTNSILPTINAFGGACQQGNGTPGGAGTVVLWPSGQTYPNLVVDNAGGTTTHQRSTMGTPLRAIGTGIWVSTNYNTYTELMDNTRITPWTTPTEDGYGVTGLFVHPDVANSSAPVLEIADNTATILYHNGDVSGDGYVGKSYIGVYSFNNVTLSNWAKVSTDDCVDIMGTETIANPPNDVFAYAACP